MKTAHGGFPDRRDWRFPWEQPAAWSLCLAGTLLVPAGWSPRLPAAEPDRPTINEIEVTTRARQALVAEPTLKPLNLFVRVHAGVATIEGPVPSVEIGQRAVQVLQTVRGVYEVRQRLYLCSPEQPKPFVIPLQPEPIVQSQSASPDVKASTPPAILAGRSQPPVEQTASQPHGNGVTLLAPVAVSAPPAPRPPALDSVRAGVEWARQSDRRFRALAVEVHESATIWVYDDPYRGEDVAAFVEALRRIPGVKSVLLKNSSR